MGVLFVLSFSAAILFLEMHRGHCAGIVGGRESIPHSRPYMAALYKENYFTCGGTLIQRNWVLTAAHCPIYNGDKVILGAHSLTKKENETQLFQVTRSVPHPNFSWDTKEHDIRLLKLSRRARINKSVRTIQLPRISKDVRVGTQCLAVGWGETSHGGRESDVLKELNVTVVNRQECSIHHHPSSITTNHLCAGVKNQKEGICHGDSGGPLICGGIQRGIASFGTEKGCAALNIPDGYTRLTKAHIVWINRNIRRR